MDITVRINKKEVVSFPILKETEKAVQIEVYVLFTSGQGSFNAGLWMPKSMLDSENGWFFSKKVKELESQIYARYGKFARVFVVEIAGKSEEV
jgi:hypothetical protein